MNLHWVADSPSWDSDKQRLIGGAKDGIFDRRYKELKPGDMAPGTWWRVLDGERTVGFGWLDVVWGDAEILLVTDPELRGKGVGSFILGRLEDEALKKGLNYLYNTVRPSHPDREGIARWLVERGFKASEDGSLVRPSRRSAA